MSFMTDFRHFLLTDTELGFGTAVGNRIYQGVNTKNDYPVCVYNVRGGDYDEYSFAGTKTFKSTQVQLDVYVKNVDQHLLEEIQVSLIERLGKYSGPMGPTGSTVIKTTQIRDIQFTYNDDTNNPLYRLLVDINLTY
jgi:hypothetical protein